MSAYEDLVARHPDMADLDDLNAVPHYSTNPDHPVLFYGGWGSNFNGQPITINGITYPTVEHFFQASKASDPTRHLMIANAATPYAAKTLGGSLATILVPGWDTAEDFHDWVAWEKMLEGLGAKFSQRRAQRDLLFTGDRYIAEDSPTDPRWGIRSGGDSRVRNQAWDGMNLLGIALMTVREEIRG